MYVAELMGLLRGHITFSPIAACTGCLLNHKHIVAMIMDACLFPCRGYRLLLGGNVCVRRASRLNYSDLMLRSDGGSPDVQHLSVHVGVLLKRGADGNFAACKSMLDSISFYSRKKILLDALNVLKDSSSEKYITLRIIKYILQTCFESNTELRLALYAIQPFLINEEFYVRTEARELVCQISKSVGLVAMINFARANVTIDDPIIREVNAVTFALIGKTHGVGYILPLIRALCASKDAWEARHSGVLIIHNIATEMGNAILPFLYSLISCIEACLSSGNVIIRIAAEVSVARLAMASYPYGDKAFVGILPQIWIGAKHQNCNEIAACLNALSCILKVLTPNVAFRYAQELCVILKSYFGSKNIPVKLGVLNCLQVSAEVYTKMKVKITIRYFEDFLNCYWSNNAVFATGLREKV